MKSYPCHLCGSPLRTAPEGLHTGCAHVHDTGRTGPLETVACLACGLVQTLPHPTRAEIDAFYATGEYRRAFQPMGVQWIADDGEATRRIVEPGEADYETAKDRLALAQAHRLVTTFEIAPSDRILEVGCGDGRVSAALVGLGFWVEAVERDPGKHAEAAARMQAAWSGSEGQRTRPVRPTVWSDRAPVSEAFDFVFAIQVAEHLPEPIADLYDNLVQFAKMGTGVVMVEVPAVERPYVSLSHFFQWPHIVNYSRHTLEAALKRCGLEETVTFVDQQALSGAGVRKGPTREYEPHGGPGGEVVAAELRAWEERRLADPRVTIARFLAGETLTDAELDRVRDDFKRWTAVGSGSIMGMGADGICGLYDNREIEDWHPDPWVRGFLAGRIYEGQRASRAVDHLVSEMLYTLNREPT